MSYIAKIFLGCSIYGHLSSGILVSDLVSILRLEPVVAIICTMHSSLKKRDYHITTLQNRVLG